MISAEIIQSIAQKRIYFAHQSVGSNILAGVKRITGDSLTVQDGVADYNGENPVFLHSLVGENQYPLSKIEEFNQILSSGLGKEIDVAMLKFCYVDFSAETNVAAVFEEYDKAVRSLISQYPALRLVHFTVPLTTVQTGPKAWVKKLLRRLPGGALENFRREEFNNLIRSHYPDVFDLALIESTYANSRRSVKIHNGVEYFSLVPEYTNDGGHLNQTGASLVAHKLLHFLSSLD